MVEKDWTSSSIRPFVIEAIEAFGIERCMFASNFPVDGIMKNYGELWQEYASLAAEFTPQEAADLLHRNAARYYRVELAISQNERTRSAIVTKDANVGGKVT
jgi:predicted TIM-barrel fold metal-dependent hydrolase